MADESLGRAVLTLATDSAQYDRGLDTAIAKQEQLKRSTAGGQVALRAFGAETARAGEKLGAFGAAAQRLGSLLPVLSVGAFTAALWSMAKAQVEAAGRTLDLANKTGLSTAAIQKMEFASSKTGAAVEAFADANFKLGVNVAAGGKRAREALAALGLEYERFRSLDPDEQFDGAIRALESVTDTQERNRLGMALFGKQWAEIAASVAEGYSDIAQAAHTSSREQLEALDAASEALEKLENDVAKGLQGWLAGVAQRITDIERGADSLSNSDKLKMFFSQPWAGLYTEQLGKVGQALRETEAEEKRRQKAEADAARANQQTQATQEDYTKTLAAARERVRELSAEQRTQLNAALQLGGDAAEKYADSIDLSETALRLYSSSLKTGSKDTDAFRKAQATLFGQDLIQRATDLSRQLGDVSNVTKLTTDKKTELHRAVTSAIEVYRLLGQTAPAALQAIAQATQPLLTSTRQWATVELKAAVANTTPFAAAVRSLGADAVPLLSASIHESRLGFVPFRAAVDDAKAALHATDGAAVSLADSIGSSLTSALGSIPHTLASAFEGGGGAAGAFKSIGVQLAGAITQPLLAELSKVKQAAVHAGAGAAAAFGGATGGGLGATVGNLAGSLGGAALAATSLGTAAATSVGAAVALGAATMGIGAAAVGVVMLGRHFFGVSKEVKAARENLTKFQSDLTQLATAEQRAEAGGRQWALTLIQVRDAYRAVGRSADEAEAITAQLLNTDDPAGSQRAMAAISAVMERAQAARAEATSLYDAIVSASATGIPAAFRPAIEQLIEMGLLTDEQAAKLRALGDAGLNVDQLRGDLESIGGRLESLGPKFQQANLDQTAGKYVNAIQRMIAAGGDVGGILSDAREEISGLVQQSLRFGTTLPANMQPWIDELARSGQLLDENGQKITDTARLKYGEPMKTEAAIAEEGWNKILEAIQALVAEIRGPLTGAINSIPTERRIRITTDYEEAPPPDAAPSLSAGFQQAQQALGLVAPLARPSYALAGVAAPAVTAPLSTLTPVVTDRSLSTTRNTTTNNVLPVLIGTDLSPHDIGQAGARYLADSALALDSHGITRAVEKVVADYQLTYRGRR